MNAPFLKSPLLSSDEEIRGLLHTARTMRAFPDGRNHYATIIDLLIAVLWASDPSDALTAADDLVDASGKLRDEKDAELMEATR